MNKERKHILVFGYGLCVLLTFFGMRFGIKHGLGGASYLFFFGALVMLILSVTYSPYLKIIYTHWMKVAHLIGQCVSTILLSIIYYAVFTPTRFFLWLAKKDYMNVKPTAASTFWKLREPKPFSPANYTRQY